MTFLSDLFNEASDTTLASHTPDTGGTWVKHPNFSGTATVNAANDWAIGDSATSALYINDVDPPSPDYSVSGPVRVNTTGAPNCGLLGRVSPSASTMYMFYHTGFSWVLEKLVAGSSTGLLNVSHTPTLNFDYYGELSMVGTTISAKVGGVHIAGSPVTDSSISSAGHPGIRLRSGGSIKNVSATAIGGGMSFAVSATTTVSLPVFSGSITIATGGATITITDLKDLTTGTLRANETGITAIINNVSTGALVALLTSQSSTAGGDMALSHASLAAATEYRVTIILADGSEGTWKYTAA